MKTSQEKFAAYISYFFILLFCYAGISKRIDFENFQVQIAQSPLLSAYAGFISYAVLFAELLIVFLLSIPRTRIAGLYASLAIMTAFTVYIYLILNYSDFIPCSCGGILEKMGWTEHLIFNLACVIIAGAGILLLQGTVSLWRRMMMILLSVIASSGIVVLLFLRSEHIIKRENNFTRRFLLHPVLEDQSVTLDHEQYYFAGSDQSHIYLGNKHYPQTLVTIDHNLGGTKKLKMMPSDFKYTFRNLQVQVKGPYYYLYDGIVPVIYRGKLGNAAPKTISYGDAYFTQLVVLDSVRFALRTQSKADKMFTIAGLDLTRQRKVKLYPGILEKQVDGVFDSDGRLTSSGHSDTLVYAYTYRNTFLIMNNQFQLKRKLHTIDTTTVAKIRTGSQSNGVHKLIAPPLKVNQNISANRNLAFIQSDLMGKHESVKSWENAKVIDIYRTDKQEYIGSFYIYNQGKNKLTDFIVTDQYLFAIVGDQLVRYTYRKPITKYFKPGEAENLSTE
jgi:hypothetical protein